MSKESGQISQQVDESKIYFMQQQQDSCDQLN